jgi:hypothetical protein
MTVEFNSVRETLSPLSLLEMDRVLLSLTKEEREASLSWTEWYDLQE